jgi:hypothetical protein
VNYLPQTHDISFLKKTIESLREEMIRLGIQEGLSSENTIRKSQELDFFISKYQNLK